MHICSGRFASIPMLAMAARHFHLAWNGKALEPGKSTSYLLQKAHLHTITRRPRPNHLCSGQQDWGNTSQTGGQGCLVNAVRPYRVFFRHFFSRSETCPVGSASARSVSQGEPERSEKLVLTAKMPGLLQTPSSAYGDTKFVVACIAEFLGTMFFTFCGSATPTGTSSQQGVKLTGNNQANW